MCFVDECSQRIKLTSKIRDEYEDLRTLPEALIKQQKEAQKAKQAAAAAAGKHKTTVEEAPEEDEQQSSSSVQRLIDTLPQKTKEYVVNLDEHVRLSLMPEYYVREDKAKQGIVALRSKDQISEIFSDTPAGGGSLVRRARAKTIRPVWHAPWKLMRVISGHLGWVRAVAVEPGNKWFATGAGDRTIKVYFLNVESIHTVTHSKVQIWDLASGTLKVTLTGHISTVRGLAISPRHPYLFSCGEDKMVKCWDLEQNKVIRHYHGHLSGVYSLSLHPTIDVLVTSGRDATARVTPFFGFKLVDYDKDLTEVDRCGICARSKTFMSSLVIPALSRTSNAKRLTRRSLLVLWIARYGYGIWPQERRWAFLHITKRAYEH